MCAFSKSRCIMKCIFFKPVRQFLFCDEFLETNKSIHIYKPVHSLVLYETQQYKRVISIMFRKYGDKHWSEIILYSALHFDLL